MEDLSKYSHSPAHLAVLRRDHVALRRIVSALPRLPKAGEVTTEEESLAGELTADAVSAVIDRREVPHRETPLHLAVRLRDPISAEILMSAGADWSLQNENGWSALQEAVCTREDSITKIIARHCQPLAWAKWCRRLPRIVSSIARIQDFYMEITFNFESSVIPFIGRIAPSDTYRIWKRGPNLRADMTLAGFDGFRIQRSDQTFLFLGQGAPSESGHPQLPPGSLIVLAHKEKEITNALEGAGAKPTEAEVAHEVALMAQTNMHRPGIDVTQADVLPHLNWRRQEKTEMVGNWKTKVYDMFNVTVSVKSRRVPGAMTDEELFTMDNDERMANSGDVDPELDEILTPEERKQLDSALQIGNSQGFNEYDENSGAHESVDNSESNGVNKEKRNWFCWNIKKASKSNGVEDTNDLKNRHSKFLENGHHNDELPEEQGDAKKGKEKGNKKKSGHSESNEHESEFKKGLRPILWLTPDFPLKTNELLPLLDILANKVKAVTRLRELLTTKLPQGTFPVKKSKMNYRAWGHRCWLISYMNSDQVFHELAKSKKWTALHVADNCCFHYRRELMLNLLKVYNEASTNCNFDVCLLYKEELKWTELLIRRYTGREALWIHRRFLTQCWIKHFTTNQGAAVTESEDLISSTTQTFLAKELQFARSFLNIADGFYDTHDQAQHAASYILWTLKFALPPESMHEEILSELRGLKPLLLKNCAVNSLGWETMLL